MQNIHGTEHAAEIERRLANVLRAGSHGIPSWNTSIDRVFNKTKMSEISEKARTQLKTELISLRESVDVVLLAIEEVSINE